MRNGVIPLFVLFLVVWGLYSESAGQQQQIDLYPAGIPLDATLLRLDRQALDEAYHQQIIKLFSVWLSQGAADPAPITTGLRNARRAYNTALTQIAQRERQLLELEKQQRERTK